MKTRSEGPLHVIRLDRGEKVIESLTGYLERKRDEIGSGFLNGIGAVSACDIGYYDLATEQYLVNRIEENCEITSLTGNIARAGGEPVIHAHITVAGPDLRVIGGHLVEGTISVTGEIWIHAAPFPVARSESPMKNIRLMRLGI